MSMNLQAYNQYKKSTVEVSPEKLLIMLYNGALKNINNAKKAIEEKDIEQAHRQIMKAEEIIVELMSTLNMEYQISERLFLLYEYLYHQLTLANAQKDIGLLDEVEGFLIELRDTWQEAMTQLKSSTPGQELSSAEKASSVSDNKKLPVSSQTTGQNPVVQKINVKG